MSEDRIGPFRRAAQTKKRRTRESLFQAALAVMRDRGMDAKVEEIAKTAGVSVPTFYNFYKSRNLLCLDACTDLMRQAMRGLGYEWRPGAQPFTGGFGSPTHTLSQGIKLVESTLRTHSHLLRAAMIGRIEQADVKLAAGFGAWPNIELHLNADNPIVFHIKDESLIDVVDLIFVILYARDLVDQHLPGRLKEYILYGMALRMIEFLMQGRLDRHLSPWVADDLLLATGGIDPSASSDTQKLMRELQEYRQLRLRIETLRAIFRYKDEYRVLDEL